METATTAKGRYIQLQPSRSTFLTRAWDCAELTIPSLLPKSNALNASLPTPYQGIGARGVNNLASKLLLALLPPNQSFFRFKISDQVLAELGGAEEKRAKIEEDLGKMERVVSSEAETCITRSPLFEALKHLLVTGNILVYLQPSGDLKIYRLDKYVVKRDASGNLLEIVVKECVHPETLPEGLRKTVMATPTMTDGVGQTVDLYTWVRRKGEFYEVHQEVADTVIPKSKGKWPIDKSPVMALRWASIDGEDYGRGHVEEYIGDLRSVEGLSAAIVEGSAAAAKVLILVNPNGSTDMNSMKAPNLSVRAGVAQDVSIVKVDKFADFRVALETLTRIEQRLAQAFLLTSAITRDAERVTAEEIRLMARELEDALGGVYSILAQEFQLPYVRRMIHQLTVQGKLPQLPPGSVKPSIVTGLDALGRGHDLQNLVQWANLIKQTVGEQAFQTEVNATDLITRISTALSIESKGLVKTPEQKAQEQQQAQQSQLMQAVGPEAIKAAAAAQQGNPNVSQVPQGPR